MLTVVNFSSMSTSYPISKAAEPQQTVVIAAAAQQQTIGPQAKQQKYQSTLCGLAVSFSSSLFSAVKVPNKLYQIYDNGNLV